MDSRVSDGPAAPAALALTGTWLLGTAPAFFITQAGTVSGTMSGTTTGSTVTLSLATTITTVGTGALAGTVITCKQNDSWVGQATNTTMTRTMIYTKQ